MSTTERIITDYLQVSRAAWDVVARIADHPRLAESIHDDDGRRIKRKEAARLLRQSTWSVGHISVHEPGLLSITVSGWVDGGFGQQFYDCMMTIVISTNTFDRFSTWCRIL